MKDSQWIVTVPPPTPNGGLHVGHLGGPYLSADVFAKQLQLREEVCAVTTFSDVNQSYVRVTAERQGRDPAHLAHQWSLDIHDTMKLFHIDIDEFPEPDARNCDLVRMFFLDLYERGMLVRKNFPAFFASDRGVLLDEAGVAGYCPRCLDQCKCGICESCGFINDATTLIGPRDTVTDSRNLEVRHVPLLVFEMERFRKKLQEFYSANARLRPRYQWLVWDALAKPLPDFPVTLVGSWGIPINHADFPGQVINAWPELVVHQLIDHKHRYPHQSDIPKVVNFLGFDNSYFYAILHVALLMAAGEDVWLPRSSITNEFYNLDHSKFSTSKGHVLWARDLATRYPTDLIRFHTMLNSPGFEKANFNEEEMTAIVDSKLTQPWGAVSRAYNRLLRDGDVSGSVRPEIHRIGTAAVDRILTSLSLDRFHLRQAAEDLIHFLDYIGSEFSPGKSGAPEFAFILKAFAQAAFPLMPADGGRLFHALTGKDLRGLDMSVESMARAIPAGLFARPKPRAREPRPLAAMHGAATA
jgi:methionyl-tRNA synthetase